MNLGNTMRSRPDQTGQLVFDNSQASQILMSMANNNLAPSRQHSTQSENAAQIQQQAAHLSNQLLNNTQRPNSLSVSLNSGLLSSNHSNGINSQTLPNRRNRNTVNRNNSFQNMANGQIPLGIPGHNQNHSHNPHDQLGQRNLSNPTGQTYSQTLRIRNSQNNNLRKVSGPSTYNSGQLSPTGGQKLAHVSTPSGSVQQVNGFNTDTLTRKNNAKPVSTPMAPNSHNKANTPTRHTPLSRTASHEPQTNHLTTSKQSDNESNSRNSSCSTNSSGINSANNASDGSNQHHRHLGLSNQNSNGSGVAAAAMNYSVAR